MTDDIALLSSLCGNNPELRKMRVSPRESSGCSQKCYFVMGACSLNHWTKLVYGVQSAALFKMCHIPRGQYSLSLFLSTTSHQNHSDCRVCGPQRCAANRSSACKVSVYFTQYYGGLVSVRMCTAIVREVVARKSGIVGEHRSQLTRLLLLLLLVHSIKHIRCWCWGRQR